MPPLYAICDAEVCEAAGIALDEYAGMLIDGGARLLQIRAKRMASGTFLDLTRRIVALASRASAAVIVNDRVDVAALSGAAGVHVGQDDLTPGEARRLLHRDAIVGVSTHTAVQIDAALDAPILYLAIGPVFATGTKDTGYTAVGLEGVRETAARVSGRFPLVAIGGITLERAASVVDAGATSVAVITDLLATNDPRARAADFVRQLSRV